MKNVLQLVRYVAKISGEAKLVDEVIIDIRVVVAQCIWAAWQIYSRTELGYVQIVGQIASSTTNSEICVRLLELMKQASDEKDLTQSDKPFLIMEVYERMQKTMLCLHLLLRLSVRFVVIGKLI